jgi:serine/threonine-protein phosphatase PGAM5
MTCRVLHFVRHGQYREQEGVFGGALTEQGWEQASLIADRLRSLPISRIWTSDMNRAIETGSEISRAMPSVPVVELPLLRELRPSAVAGIHVPLEVRRQGRERLDAIEKRFFREPTEERHGVLVCHGNLIRSLVVRYLGGGATAWTRLTAMHCSMTTWVYQADGSFRLVLFGDVGHMPVKLYSSV